MLDKMSIKVFYDKHETITLWGKDLFEYLQDVYKNKANYTIIFCSKNYAKKLWTNHEKRAAQARAFESNREYILPARFDNTEIPGILSTTGYVNLNEYTPEEFAELIKKKVGPIRRYNYFPKTLDLLYKKIHVQGKKSKELALLKTYSFFRSMSLMTEDERIFFTKIVLHSCPCGRPNEIHQELGYLERILELNSNEIKQKLGRISSLDFEIIIEKSKPRPYHIVHPETEKIIIKFSVPYLTKKVELRDGAAIIKATKIVNATDVIYEIIEIIFSRCCINCAWNSIKDVDFSSLSSLEGFDDH
jgi:hypothetical protein